MEPGPFGAAVKGMDGLDRGCYLGYYVQLLLGACTNQGLRPPHDFPAIEPTAIKRNCMLACVTVWAGRTGEQQEGRKGQLDWSGGRKGRKRRALSQGNGNWHEHLRIGDWPWRVPRIKGSAPFSRLFLAFSLESPHAALSDCPNSQYHTRRRQCVYQGR